jgi:hypothetical protein
VPVIDLGRCKVGRRASVRFVTPEEALAVLIERAPTGDLRVEACKVLSEAGDHRAVAVLLEALVDPTGDSHLAIATELVILGDRARR